MWHSVRWKRINKDRKPVCVCVSRLPGDALKCILTPTHTHTQHKIQHKVVLFSLCGRKAKKRRSCGVTGSGGRRRWSQQPHSKCHFKCSDDQFLSNVSFRPLARKVRTRREAQVMCSDKPAVRELFLLSTCELIVCARVFPCRVSLITGVLLHQHRHLSASSRRRYMLVCWKAKRL